MTNLCCLTSPLTVPKNLSTLKSSSALSTRKNRLHLLLQAVRKGKGLLRLAAWSRRALEVPRRAFRSLGFVKVAVQLVPVEHLGSRIGRLLLMMVTQQHPARCHMLFCEAMEAVRGFQPRLLISQLGHFLHALTSFVIANASNNCLRVRWHAPQV